MLWVDTNLQWDIWTRTRKNMRNLCINCGMMCYMDLFWMFFLLYLSLSCVVPHFFLPFLLYEPSPPFSYIVLIHLDNFWPYRALFSWFFIINGDFWGLLYCSDVHLYNFWSYRAHLFFGFSSWTETSRVLLPIQACHSALNTLMLGRWPSLMRRLLCNH